ncbi:hypothetical protein GCM10018781_80520 [Kitasatospora indigofera]|uniref:Uncharacterized protein n=1 Tax=Kitasatospora indigofera TaxID=67307 RepID=A0A919D8U0_9ACTN|nr:hypothetical protein [Kitasatospora indigofera]GHE27939.1 hypothetical protein GCM10018781_80520 [Kitasatospora indigofera]
MNEHWSPVGSDQEQRPEAVSSAARTVQDKAGEGAQVVADNAADVAGTVQEQASQVVGEAAAQARDLLSEARGQLQEQARAQTGRLAENVRQLAHELRDMADQGKADSTATAAVAQIADSGHRVADRLDRRGPDGLLEDVRDFARRRPALFLAGAALTGFALGRTGKGVAAAGSSSRTVEDRPTGREERPGGSEFPPPVPLAAPAPAAARVGPAPPVAGSRSGPYEGYGQSQPPHLTPAYGRDPARAGQQSAQGV